jgi:hypothetical protein
LNAVGEVKLQLSARSVGLFEAFYSSTKPLRNLDVEIQLAGKGHVRRGVTEIPFSFKLHPSEGRYSIILFLSMLSLFPALNRAYTAYLPVHSTIAITASTSQ